jgi:hypothetical protein
MSAKSPLPGEIVKTTHTISLILAACLALAPSLVQAQAVEGSMPDAQSPDAQSPDARSPDAQSPDAQAPVAQSPDAQSPDAQSPDAQAPDAEATAAQAPAAEAPAVQASDSPTLTIAAWSAVGGVAISAAIVGLTQLRIGEINGDPEWLAARASYPEGTTDICAEPSLAPRVRSSCDDMEALWATAIGVGVTSLVGAVTFFILDGMDVDQSDSLQVSASATPDRFYLGLNGRF